MDDVLKRLGRPERCGQDSRKFEQLLATLNEDEWYPPLLSEFFDLLDHRSSGDREGLIGRFFEEVYPSAAYFFLALLVREGFFKIIFNANYDPLLDIALSRYLPPTDAVGRPVYRWRKVINRADRSAETEIKTKFDSRTPPIKALWLHGLILESGIAFTPREKKDWYPNVKDVVEDHFGRDLLLIGYTDRDVDIFSAVQNAQGTGTIWYVAPARPDVYMANALGARNHEIISDQAADFDTFCQVLFDLTLDLTDPKQVKIDDTRRVQLLREKVEILHGYVSTITRRQKEDPMAPPSLQEQKEAMEEILRILQ